MRRVFSTLKRAAFAGILGSVLLLPTSGLIQQTSVAQVRGPESVADLAESLTDAVVNISTSQTISGSRSIPMPQVPEGSPFKEFFEDFFNQQQPNTTPRRVNSLGSGFVVDADGIVITNNHVIEGADEIEVVFNDGSSLPAEIIGRDDKTDLAVLKVEPEKPLTAVPFGDSEAMRVGDWVMAIGNPFGLGGTVTVGIISATKRDIGSGPYDAFIQTDASINRGNSGGPLFNMKGEVIGVNTAIISPTGGSIGIGFAIPSSTALQVISQLREFGETRRGWLGVRIQEVTDEIAEGLGLEAATGALVAGVTEGGPAEAAGIERGDVITEFDGKLVPTSRALPRMVATKPVGDAVNVVVVRRGEEQTIQVQLGRLEDGERMEAGESLEDEAIEDEQGALPSDVLGLTVSSMTDQLRDQYGISETTSGVVITEVNPASSAFSKGVRAGNVVLEIGQVVINTPDEFVSAIENLKEMGRRQALLLIQTEQDEIRFVALPIE